MRWFDKQPEFNIDWILFFYFEYFTARAGADRKIELSERILEFFGNLIRKRAKSDPRLFTQMSKPFVRVLAETIAEAFENIDVSPKQLVSNPTSKSLYKILKAALLHNDQVFLFLSDRKDFFKSLIY